MRRDLFGPVLTVLAVVAILTVTVLTERRFYLTAQKLEDAIAQSELLTERTQARNEKLKNEIERARRELASIAELPLLLGRNADALKAALEQCALSCGAGCVVSAAESSAVGRMTLEAALRTSPAKAVAFLREVMKRREFFLPQRLEWRVLEPGLISVEIELDAFIELAAAGEGFER